MAHNVASVVIFALLTPAAASSLIRATWKPQPGDTYKLYEHSYGSTLVQPCPKETQTSIASCQAYFADKADGEKCPQITCPKALGATFKLICGGGCCPSCWAPDHVVAVDRHTSIDDAAVVPIAPAAPPSCEKAKCFELLCAAGESKGYVQGDCCYSCVPSR
mmetsp:Transcript_148067/g.258284  ORF Transcript_148067/g.258284 Transcript_148067/m.258284 type:complete len:162 (+) Transcript_148067:84-569(+)